MSGPRWDVCPWHPDSPESHDRRQADIDNPPVIVAGRHVVAPDGHGNPTIWRWDNGQQPVAILTRTITNSEAFNLLVTLLKKEATDDGPP